VIQLRLPQRAEVSVQPMLFADDGGQESPPWLIEAEATPEVKPAKAKKVVAKKPAKKSATARKGKPTAAKKVRVTAAPKRTVTAKRAPSKPAKAVTATAPNVEAVATDETAPLQRAMAPVVWRKTGPIDVVRFWLRSAGTSLKAMLGPREGKAATGSVADPRLRTRKELLIEVAILRQENAAMRKKLGLHAAPFGRLVADRI
jgi:hypothetical protein